MIPFLPIYQSKGPKFYWKLTKKETPTLKCGIYYREIGLNLLSCKAEIKLYWLNTLDSLSCAKVPIQPLSSPSRSQVTKIGT